MGFRGVGEKKAVAKAPLGVYLGYANPYQNQYDFWHRFGRILGNFFGYTLGCPTLCVSPLEPPSGHTIHGYYH